MRYNKNNAFTMAEVMILLLILTILLAAFSPVFTTRFNDYSLDEVWTFVPGDDNNDAYYDNPNKSMTAQAFIGMTPGGPTDIAPYVSNQSNTVLYSKLVIRASDSLKVGLLSNQAQNQMQFRYGKGDFGNQAGKLVGSLFAGKGNFLVGGSYEDITNSAENNTSYGRSTLEKLTSGKSNTAIGYQAGNKLENQIYNTFVGNSAGYNVANSGNAGYNTLIGTNAGHTISSGFNTIIGNNSTDSKISGYGNTFVGNNIGLGTTVSGNMNTAMGNYAMTKATSGSGNTAVGYNSLSELTSGSYNTAIGLNACQGVESGSYKTCIGPYSGVTKNESGSNTQTYSNLFTGDHERVFIGGYPRQYSGHDNKYNEKPAAILEVHNITNSNSKDRKPLGYMPDASVVINGNLIVRGQSYFEAPIARPTTVLTSLVQEPHLMPRGLIAFKLHKVAYGRIQTFSGDDGYKRDEKSKDDCNGCRSHAFKDVRKHCICTSTIGGSDSTYSEALNENYAKKAASENSYDWSSPAYNNSSTSDCRKSNPNGDYYTDRSLNKNFTIKNTNKADKGDGEVDFACAHLKAGRDCSDEADNTSNASSCCPILTSDRRLKDVGTKFTAGLAELKKLNIYNFTFKSDKNNAPHVGVIAQDLKTVFPNAVTKAADGYLKIRWDEMFYALINAVKDINTRVTKLANKVATDKEKISNLKKDNANLNAQLDKLADEITVLEAKRK